MAGHRHRLREMEALRALVTTGTTLAAARRLGVSQSSDQPRARPVGTAGWPEAVPAHVRARIEPLAAALRSECEQLDPLFETLARIEGAEWAAADEEPLRLIVPPTLAHNFIIQRVAAFLKQNPGKEPATRYPGHRRAGLWHSRPALRSRPDQRNDPALRRHTGPMAALASCLRDAKRSPPCKERTSSDRRTWKMWS